MTRPRVVLLADRCRRSSARLVDDVRRCIEAHADVVAELDAGSDPLPDLDRPDLAVVLGGDGTLISQARRVLEADLPLVGVNVGRLGFLSEFDVDSLLEHAPAIFGGGLPIQEYLAIRAELVGPDGTLVDSGLAINECVVTAGPPFRMIELRIDIDGAEGPTLTGDGVIVATPIGSTAYNVSAGGPIVHHAVDCMIITPLAAHSLAFRPIVVSEQSRFVVHLVRSNEGTTVVLDGQVQRPMDPGMTLRLAPHPKRACFVANPGSTYWRILLDKMRWAAPPTYRDRGG
jgi:NAD+ kinase